MWAEAEAVNALDVMARLFCNEKNVQEHMQEGCTDCENTLPEIEHHTDSQIMSHNCLILGNECLLYCCSQLTC